ncbi:MAG: acyl carrier protein [Proteobacteria bacterium]|nr:acyl carrier protein [Pseudomonadota bacterium]MBU1585642.1 acyl carrier protein [Pseudomonadota bacterium]MBU2629640.1 acyl carrier protein [Pseudomonadota bacterium]
MSKLSNEAKEEIRELIINFLAEECEIDRSEFNDESNINDELGGDSLMFIELIELLKTQYDFNVELQAITKYLITNPAETVGKVISLAYLLCENELPELKYA